MDIQHKLVWFPSAHDNSPKGLIHMSAVNAKQSKISQDTRQTIQ